MYKRISKKQVYFAIFLMGVTLIFALGLLVMLRHKTTETVPPRDLKQIREEGTLKLVTEYNPIGYYVSDSSVMGFQYELIKAISQVSGIATETKLEMNLSKSFKMLDDETCDVIARNISITKQNRDHYIFTDPILLNKQVLVQRNKKNNEGIEPIRNQLDLAGKTLYIPSHSPALLRLNNLQQEIGDSIHVVEDKLYSTEQLIMMVAKKEIDFAVCNWQIAKRLQNDFPSIDLKTDISFTQLESWAVRKTSPQLADSLNYWLNLIKDKGIYDRIYSRYYQ